MHTFHKNAKIVVGYKQPAGYSQSICLRFLLRKEEGPNYTVFWMDPTVDGDAVIYSTTSQHTLASIKKDMFDAKVSYEVMEKKYLGQRASLQDVFM